MTGSTGGAPGCRCTRITRRRLLGTAVVASVTAVAGCLGDGETEPREPIALTDGQTCVVCGMEIAAHYGPAVQAHYAGGEADGLAVFDSVREFLSYDADQRRTGADRVVAYATDYATVPYTVEERDEGAYISTHADADDFAVVTDLHYVVDSDIHGAMGPDAVPFSDEGEAAALAAEYGGTVVGWDDL